MKASEGIDIFGIDVKGKFLRKTFNVWRWWGFMGGESQRFVIEFYSNNCTIVETYQILQQI